MKIYLCFYIALLTLQLQSGFSMTVGDDDVLPDELKPITRGGSWFDDMAIERLNRKHQKLKNSGDWLNHSHEDDSEEMFILAKLGKLRPQKHHPVMANRESLKLLLKGPRLSHSLIRGDSEEKTFNQPIIGQPIQVARKPVIIDPHSHLHNENPSISTLDHFGTGLKNLPISQSDKAQSMTTDEFLFHYEEDLRTFFKNFMAAMLKADIHEVRIEERKESEETL